MRWLRARWADTPRNVRWLMLALAIFVVGFMAVDAWRDQPTHWNANAERASVLSIAPQAAYDSLAKCTGRSTPAYALDGIEVWFVDSIPQRISHAERDHVVHGQWLKGFVPFISRKIVMRRDAPQPLTTLHEFAHPYVGIRMITGDQVHPPEFRRCGLDGRDHIFIGPMQ